MNLHSLRHRINDIDEKIVALFKERMDIVNHVATYKKEHNLPVLDRSREKHIIKRFMGYDFTEEFKKDLKDFLETMMFISRRSQERLLSNGQNPSFQFTEAKESVTTDQFTEAKEGVTTEVLSKKYCVNSEIPSNNKVGFLGVAGSFSHKAFENYFLSAQISKTNITPNDYVGIGYKNFRDIFTALSDNSIQYAILPMENSSTGGVIEVYDLMLEFDFNIIGEQCLKIDHNLLGVKGTVMEDISTIYSHPQGISQCSDFLNKHKSWQLIPHESTATSAALVKNSNNKSLACIAGLDAANIYGLDILCESICSSTNFTRFVVIAKDKKTNAANNKISILMSLSHTAGSLFRVLKYFDEHNINMLKIESRPVKGRPWEYYFFIDFTGNIMEEATQNMLECMDKECLSLKLLGNYKCEIG